MLTSRLLHCSLSFAHATPVTAQLSSPLVLAVSLQRKMQLLSCRQLSGCVSANAGTHLSRSTAVTVSGVVNVTPRTLVACFPSSNRSCCQAKHLLATTQRHGRAKMTTASAAPKPMGQRPAPLKPNGPSAVEGRLNILESLALESFKIAGVSFEDRQEHVCQLQPGEGPSSHCLASVASLKLVKPDSMWYFDHRSGHHDDQAAR